MKDIRYFTNLATRLLHRSGEGAPYRRLLEEKLGFSLEDYIVSTAEHTAPFNLATTLSFLLPFSATARRLGPQVKLLILPGSLIPLDNAHQPRGLHIPQLEKRINFFSGKYKHDSPLLLPPANEEAFCHTLEQHHFEDIARVFDTGSRYENFASQLCSYMMRMYRSFFTDAVLPQLKVIPLEHLTSQVLASLIRSGDPFVEAVLFNREGRRLVLRLLQGVYCAWGDEKGSFLFWKRRGDGLKRFVYNEREDLLECDGLRIPFEKESLLHLLGSAQVLPGVFLSLMMSSYLPNLPVSAGPKQLRYYTSMIRTANELKVVYRDESLANLGYMDFKPETIAPGIPSVGTGAYLLQNKICLRDVEMALARTTNDVLL